MAFSDERMKSWHALENSSFAEETEGVSRVNELITRWTAFGRETAVGLVAMRRSAAVTISFRYSERSLEGAISECALSAATAARAILPAPRISIFFIFSAVSLTSIDST